jgi:PAS domain S-box-containing protein
MKDRHKNNQRTGKLNGFEEEYFSEIFNSSPAAKALSEYESGVILDVNESWEKFTGHNRSEVLGKTGIELNIINPAHLENLQEMLSESVLIRSYRIEINRKSNEKAYGLATFQLLENENSKLVLTSIVDISDLVKSTKELKVLTNFSDRLLESVYEAVFILDKDLKCIRINKAFKELTGYTEKDVINKKAPFPHWPPEEYDNIKEYFSIFLAGELSRDQLTFKRVDGERFQVRISTTEILDENNELLGYASTAVDISEQVKHQNSLIAKSIKAREKKNSILELLNLKDENFDEFLKAVTKISANVLEVNRVSVWKFSDDKTKIKCLKAYHSEEEEFLNHDVLKTENYPNYFDELHEQKIISVYDIATDNVINKDYKAQYLNKFNIKSMLDAFIMGTEQPFGVICFEQIGQKRQWSPEDEQFVTTIASVISLALEHNQRRKVQQELEHTNKKLTSSLAELNKLKQDLEHQNVYLREEIDLVFNYEEMVYGSAIFSNVLTEVERVANTDATVFLYGETGTGKELIARAIHNNSDRKQKPLIKVNCAAIPSELIESELFGHKKGSFTGAFSDKMGKFMLADGGTLFLDEIGELPLEMQPKLLRAIQDFEIEPIGDSKVHKVDIRIITATNRNLKDEVKNKRFREDLYYRINVFPIHVPPLRERQEDIPILIEHFVNKFCKKYGKDIKLISQETRDALYNYDWPGNIRELENLIERSVILSNKSSLFVPGFITSDNESPIDLTALSLNEVQRLHIKQTLKKCNWKIDGPNGAAEVLDIKPSTLRDRMKKLGVTKS